MTDEGVIFTTEGAAPGFIGRMLGTKAETGDVDRWPRATQAVATRSGRCASMAKTIPGPSASRMIASSRASRRRYARSGPGTRTRTARAAAAVRPLHRHEWSHRFAAFQADRALARRGPAGHVGNRRGAFLETAKGTFLIRSRSSPPSNSRTASTPATSISRSTGRPSPGSGVCSTRTTQQRPGRNERFPSRVTSSIPARPCPWP